MKGFIKMNEQNAINILASAYGMTPEQYVDFSTANVIAGAHSIIFGCALFMLFATALYIGTMVWTHVVDSYEKNLIKSLLTGIFAVVLFINTVIISNQLHSLENPRGVAINNSVQSYSIFIRNYR